MGPLARAAIAATCITFGGCLVDIDYSGTQYECAQSHICPPGFSCQSGRCIPSGGGPDGGGDGGTTNGCGATTMFTDNFDDNARAPLWDQSYASGGVTTAQTGGYLVVTVPDNAQGNGGYQAAHRADLTGDRVFIEVPQVASTTTHAETYLTVDGLDNNDSVSIVQENGMLRFQKKEAGTTTMLDQVAYDSSAHRWWQIREAGGTIFFETSANGTMFTQRASTATPSWVPYASIEFGAGAYTPQAGNGAAHFDSLNGGNAPAGSWCRINSLRDNFNDGMRSPDWLRAYSVGSCNITEANGGAVFTPSTSGANECAYSSAKLFDLRGDAVATHASQVLRTSLPTYTFMSVNNVAGDQIYIQQTGSNLVTGKKIAGTVMDLSTTTYNSSSHAWWRIREAGGMAFWETAPDGANWTVQHMEADPFSLAAVDVTIGAGLKSSVPNPGQARFDNVN